MQVSRGECPYDGVEPVCERPAATQPHDPDTTRSRFDATRLDSDRMNEVASALQDMVRTCLFR